MQAPIRASESFTRTLEIRKGNFEGELPGPDGGVAVGSRVVVSSHDGSLVALIANGKNPDTF